MGDEYITSSGSRWGEKGGSVQGGEDKKGGSYYPGRKFLDRSTVMKTWVHGVCCLQGLRMSLSSSCSKKELLHIDMLPPVCT